MPSGWWSGAHLTAQEIGPIRVNGLEAFHDMAASPHSLLGDERSGLFAFVAPKDLFHSRLHRLGWFVQPQLL
jgi:hypothetical protein